jgi:hypothetical protein
LLLLRLEEELDLTVLLPLLRLLLLELLRLTLPLVELRLLEELDLTVLLPLLRLLLLELLRFTLPLVELRLLEELDLTVLLPLLRLEEELVRLLFTALRFEELLVVPRLTLPLVVLRLLLLVRAVLTAPRLPPLLLRLAVASGRYTLTALLSTTVVLPELVRTLLLSTR